MKILFVSNLYPPNVVGGYERLCADVAAHVVAAGWDVTVLTSCFGRQVSRPRGQTVHQALRLLVGDTVYEPFAGSPAQRDAVAASNATALRRVVAETRPDRIFCWNLFGLDGGFLDALVDCGVPIVFMLTDNWLAAMFKPDFVGWYFANEVFAAGTAPPAADRAPIHFPGVAIFGSDYMARFYAEAGLSFGRSRVVHNGVRPLRPAVSAPDRRELVADGRFELLFAGRVVSLKGLHTAVEALPLVRGPVPVRLTIVGDERDAPYSAEIRGLIARLGLEESVRWSPSVAEDELADLFGRFDAYLFPSIYEPFSLTLIHALAAGIPTVASAVGGNVEIVRDGETGLLFPRGDAAGLADAIRRLMEAPALRERLSAAGRAAGAQFTFERMAGAMMNVIAD